MDVGDWLQKLGLDQYEAKFRENEIDADILPELTEIDLEKLGVPLGHRKRLLKAIASLSAEKGVTTLGAAAAGPNAAERRQVTVLFCDLIGSTALSGAIDPEAMSKLIRRYQDAAAGAIGRYGGFVAKFMGDGILAYFGFPRAYEDAAERAIRAALAIIAEVGGVARPDGEPLQARVGIATGLVVVGEIIGAGAAQEHGIFGETPNLAARLQALAAPDTILISEATQHLLGELFELEAIGPLDLRGFATPVSAWCVLREAALPGAEGMQRQVDFLLKLGPSLMVVRGYQNSEVEGAYRRAAEIAEALGAGTESFKAKWGLWLHGSMTRKTRLARDRARELVTLAERSGDDDLLLEAYHCRWSTAFFCGDVAAALDDCRIGVSSYDMARHRHLGQAFGGHDPGVCAQVVNAMALQMASNRDGAKESVAQALALAEALDHPASLGHALTNCAMCYQLAADREMTFAFARRMAALAEKFGLLPLRASSMLLTGWTNAIGSGMAEAARIIDAEIGNATAVGPLPQYYLGLAGEVLLAADRPADGLAHLDRAIAAIDEPGVGFYLPEIYRLRGACLLALESSNKGEAHQAFATARDFAKQQGAILFERRAETALGEIAKTPTIE